MFTNSPLRTLRQAATLLLVGSLITLNACKPSEVEEMNTPRSSARLASDAPVYLLTDNNRLLRVTLANTTMPTATITITGIASGDVLRGIDFRPATGQLYGVTRGSRLYAINPMTGAATALGSGPFMPTVMGDDIGFDFNPTVDRIRLVTNNGQNLRLNPETGTVQVIDGNINGAPGARLTGAAYTNNRSGVTTTTLYVIDPVTDKLYRQDPPNNGTLVEIGSLGVNAAGTGSFDIAPDGNTLATLIVDNQPAFFEIDLATGRATKIGNLPDVGMSIVGLAIPTEPVAYAVEGGNMLVTFNPMNPSSLIRKTIMGLQDGEMIRGIDFRPVNGQLYALGSTSRLYTINTSSGAAAVVGSGPLSTPLSGTEFGFDFNPTVDRIRVTSNTGQNLRLNPDNAAVAAVDGTLRLAGGGRMPTVPAAAYTNNFAGATTTTLYVMDNNTMQLFTQNPPNDGVLNVVGSLGIMIEGGNGFDIGGTSNAAYALLRSGGMTRVYSINLATGAATMTGNTMLGPVSGMALGLGF